MTRLKAAWKRLCATQYNKTSAEFAKILALNTSDCFYIIVYYFMYLNYVYMILYIAILLLS